MAGCSARGRRSGGRAGAGQGERRRRTGQAALWCGSADDRISLYELLLWYGMQPRVDPRVIPEFATSCYCPPPYARPLAHHLRPPYDHLHRTASSPTPCLCMRPQQPQLLTPQQASPSRSACSPSSLVRPTPPADTLSLPSSSRLRLTQPLRPVPEQRWDGPLHRGQGFFRDRRRHAAKRGLQHPDALRAQGVPAVRAAAKGWGRRGSIADSAALWLQDEQGRHRRQRICGGRQQLCQAAEAAARGECCRRI